MALEKVSLVGGLRFQTSHHLPVSFLLCLMLCPCSQSGHGFNLSTVHAFFYVALVIVSYHSNKKKNPERNCAGLEMVLWIRELTPLADDLSLVRSTKLRWLTSPIISYNL